MAGLHPHLPQGGGNARTFPQNCVALEDSPNGIKSASSAGCVTVMVPDLDKPSNDIIPLLHGVADGLSDVKRILRELEDCNIQ